MTGQPAPTSEKAYETRDLSARILARILCGLLSFALIAVGVTYEMVTKLRHTTAADLPTATAIETTPITPPAPRLQTAPRIDLGETEAHVRAQLNSYGWVDRAQGIAHIPIDRAMALTVGKSLDAPP